jgi:hypothetical protein
MATGAEFDRILVAAVVMGYSKIVSVGEEYIHSSAAICTDNLIVVQKIRTFPLKKLLC